MKRITILFWFLLMVMAGSLASCIKTGYDNNSTSSTTLPDEGAVLTEVQIDDYLTELMARGVMAGLNPEAKCNDPKRFWGLLSLLASQPGTKSYSPDPETRGIWSQAKAVFDFKKSIQGACAQHRATLIGAMVSSGYSKKADREQIFNQIVKGVDKALPAEYTTDAETFWTAFSKGELDANAIDIYHAVFAENVVSESTSAQKLAEYLLDKNLREIDMALSCIGPIIEAGANVVFAYGDDLIQTGKLAYDFVEVNGKLMMEAVNGNLTGETCIDAFNNNLKLLTKGLKEIVPTSQDLTEVLADLTAEQIKALSKEIDQALQDAGNATLSDSALDWFVYRAGIILKQNQVIDYLDKEFEGPSKSILVIHSNGGSYTFDLTTKDHETILYGRCSPGKKYMSILISDIDVAKAKELRMLPKGGKTYGVGDILSIPYWAQAAYKDYTDVLWLWYNTSEQESRIFSLKEGEVFVEPTELHFDAEGGTQNVKVHFGSYAYYGATVRAEGKGWVSLKAVGSDVSIDITVKPNENAYTRECVVDCWVANEKDPADNQKVIMPVKVTQDAGKDDTGEGTPIITEVTFLKFNLETDADTHLVWTEPKEEGGGGSMRFNEMYYMWHRDWDQITFTQSGSTLTIKAKQNTKGPNGDMMFDSEFLLEVVVTGLAEPYDNCRVQTASYKAVFEGKTTLTDPYWYTTSAKDQATLSSIPLDDHDVYSGTGDFYFQYSGKNNVSVSGYSAVNHSTTVDGYYQDRNHYYVGSDADLGVVEVMFKYKEK